MWRSSSSDKNFYVVSRQFSPAKSFVYLWSLYNSLYCILYRQSRSGYIGAQPIGYSLVKLCQILCITFSYLLNTWQSSSARTSSAYSTDFRVHFISHSSSSMMLMMTQFLVFKRQMILFHSPYLNVEIVELWLSVFVCFVRLVFLLLFCHKLCQYSISRIWIYISLMTRILIYKLDINHSISYS